MSKIRVAVGLSGGVDSAVSAYLLKKRGFDVSGVYLHCFDDDAPGCRGKQDRQDALSVALHLKIPFQVLDFRKQYKSAVIGYFKKEYLAGRTPNPDVVCNRDIKFGLFLDWVIKQGFDYVATGHYARLVPLADSRNSRTTAKYANPLAFAIFAKFRDFREMRLDTSSKLKRTPDDVILTQPRDLHKDQTYFLWAVPRKKFRRVLFPLADFRKQDVRSVAKFAKIPVADKPDSTGICFIGEVRVEDFLKRLGVKEKMGEVVTSFGRVIGRHRGVAFYTIGQRHGFSTDLWSSKNKAEGKRQKAKGNTRTAGLLPSSFFLLPSINRPPLYVIGKDIKANRLIVGFGAECYRSQFTVSQINWLSDHRPWTMDHRQETGRRPSSIVHRPSSIVHRPSSIYVRIRHGGDLIPCSLKIDHRPWTTDHGPETVHRLSSIVYRPLSITVRLREPQRGIAAGQSAVFYFKERMVLGGGVIQ